MHKCPRCQETKPAEAFGHSMVKLKGRREPRRRSYCKPCCVKVTAATNSRQSPQQRAKNRQNQKRAKLLRTYGISPEQYEAQIAAQHGRCAICLTELAALSPQTVHVDHCHATGAVRGVLCSNCNLGLGNFQENIEAMKAAATYLQTGGVWEAR